MATPMNNTGNALGSVAPADLQDNAQVLDKLINGDVPSVTGRFGKELKSWSAIQGGFDNIVSSLDGDALIKKDAPTGIAETTNGQYFRTYQDISSPYSFNYYKNVNGTAVLIARTVGNDVMFIDSSGVTTLHSLQDANGNSVVRVEVNGEVYLPNMQERSVQESVERAGRLNKNIKINYAPGILKLTDAQNSTMAILDQDFGDYFLPGMGSQSLQDYLSNLKDRVNRMYKGTAIFDSWNDFGIPWNGNDRAWTYKRIQAAIDHITRLPYGGTLYLRAGVYPLYLPLTPKNNVNIVMERGARFLPVRGLSAFVRQVTSGDLDSYLKNATFIDVEIDGSEQYTTGAYNSGIKGMYITGFSDCLFLRCNIHDTGATGMGIDFAHNSFILDGRYDGCGRLAPVGSPGASGIGIGSGAQADEALIISRNLCRGNRNNGIFVEQQRLDFVSYRSRQIIVTENVCTANNHGFSDCGAEGIIVANNQFNDNLSHGVAMDTGTLPVSGGRPQPGVGGIMANNQILRNGAHGIYYDGRTVQSGGNYHFQGNILQGNAGSGYAFTGGANTIPDIMISGGQVADGGGPAVLVASGTMTDFDIDGVRMLRNAGDAGIVLNGNVSGGTVWNNRIRPAGSQKAISGSGNISRVDISNNLYSGTNPLPVTLTGVQTSVTWGRNPGF